MRTAVLCAKCLATAIIYAVLGITALLFAVGAGYEADERLQKLTVLLWRAAASADASTAAGLDGAMTAIASTGAGPWLLTAVAAGSGTFGVYAPARARYPDRDPRPSSGGRPRRR